ncbi:MAG TPA: hypothetical protein PLM07_08215 [Candidatus Rifleibacterium sp.]|nr:hypothetical protein [Candidatus Rifleibacterium sp.]HPT45869.1 hypothetical protein [Candidatus Rifleibacterium sp.]
MRLDLDWAETISSERLSRFLKLSGISPKSDKRVLLQNLGAGEIKDNKFYLSHTGVLFFGKNPTYWNRGLEWGFCLVMAGAVFLGLLGEKLLCWQGLEELFNDDLVFFLVIVMRVYYN